MEIADLLTWGIKKSASDLHLSAGLPPIFRIDGDLHKINNYPILDNQQIKNLIYSIMDDKQCQQFESKSDIDFAFSIEYLARFRINLFQQFRGISSVIRFISSEIPMLEKLNFPEIIKNICHFPNGLILITGPAGSGKTTTLTAMINYINHHEYKHIITIEDPIEFVHTSHYSLINQREINQHTINFTTALRSALREDPNIILIGELRDLETIRLALTAAETGHLVLATLHTSSTIKAINRMINVFPSEEKEMIRSQIAETLQAIVCQHLIKKTQGGRIAGLEILLCLPAIRHLIRKNQINQIYSIIETNLNLGMQTLDHHLKLLINQEIITRKTAEALALNKEFLY